MRTRAARSDTAKANIEPLRTLLGRNDQKIRVDTDSGYPEWGGKVLIGAVAEVLQPARGEPFGADRGNLATSEDAPWHCWKKKRINNMLILLDIQIIDC